MTALQNTITAEHLQSAIDAVLGLDPSQAPTDAPALNERLSISQSAITETVEFLFKHQASKHLSRGVPLIYVLLEAANLAHPEEMKLEFKPKSFAHALASVAGDAQEAARGEGAMNSPLRLRFPELVDFLDKQLQAENGFAKKMSFDDRAGLYALGLGTLRAIDKHLSGAERPVTIAKVPGRNELCPCGSGKKYKKCHGAEA